MCIQPANITQSGAYSLTSAGEVGVVLGPAAVRIAVGLERAIADGDMRPPRSFQPVGGLAVGDNDRDLRVATGRRPPRR